MDQRPACDVAFCCVALLFRREQLNEILNILPEGRRRQIHERLTEISGWPVVELRKQITALRRADMMEAARRCGSAGDALLEPLPVPLERWLNARAWEFNGREDH
jgi:hypothetical protein